MDKENDYIEVLGIDQGYANCGVAVIRYYENRSDNNVEILKIDTLCTKSSENMNKRVEYIYNSIVSIINEYNIDVIGCEKLFVNNPMINASKGGFFKIRNKSADIVNTSFITGVIFLLSSLYNKAIYEFSPTSIKKRVTNNGKATKEELTLAISKIASYGKVKIKTNHESDAIGIAISSAKEYLGPKAPKKTVKITEKKNLKECLIKRIIKIENSKNPL